MRPLLGASSSSITFCTWVLAVQERVINIYNEVQGIVKFTWILSKLLMEPLLGERAPWNAWLRSNWRLYSHTNGR